MTSASNKSQFINVDDAAKMLGITRSPLYRYMRILNIETVSFSPDRKAYIAVEDLEKIRAAKEACTKNRPSGTCRGVCSRCHRKKDVSEFYKDAHFKSGHKPECKQCERGRRRDLAIKSRSILTHKRCTACRETKTVDQFYKSDQHVSGYLNHCIDCYERKRNTKQGRERPVRKKLNVGRDGPTRWCYGCSTEKPSGSFVKDGRTKHGYYTYCRECHTARSREYYLANVEQVALKNQAYRATIDYHEQYTKYRWRLLAKNKRRHALKKKAKVEPVSLERVLARDGYWCYICEKPIDPNAKVRSAGYLSFDHVIPLVLDGPHSEDNLKPVHFACNSRKQARTLDQLTPFDRRGPDESPGM